MLREIYARETNTHIATVRAYLEREAGLPEPHVLPEDVYRACHTLSGSSKMATIPMPQSEFAAGRYDNCANRVRPEIRR